MSLGAEIMIRVVGLWAAFLRPWLLRFAVEMADYVRGIILDPSSHISAYRPYPYTVPPALRPALALGVIIIGGGGQCSSISFTLSSLYYPVGKIETSSVDLLEGFPPRLAFGEFSNPMCSGLSGLGCLSHLNLSGFSIGSVDDHDRLCLGFCCFSFRLGLCKFGSQPSLELLYFLCLN
nr:uncharacterized protein LOC117278110 [Nicotiana tomentosiformis]